jgi:hypothetical protein
MKKDHNFPVIRDVDGVLAGHCEKTHGGIMTIKPPGYVLAVTNPSDVGPSPSPDIVSAQGQLPDVNHDSTTIVFVGGTQLIPGPPGPTGPAGSTRMPTPLELTISNSAVIVDAGHQAGTVLFAPIYLRITLTENVTFLNPLNGADSQRLIIEVRQDAVGGRTIAWSSAYQFGTDVPFALQSAAANKRDFYAFVLTNGVWDCVGVTRGY